MTGKLAWIGGLAGVSGLGILWIIVAVERDRMLQLTPRTELRRVIEAHAAEGLRPLRPEVARAEAPARRAEPERAAPGGRTDAAGEETHRMIVESIFEDAHVADLLLEVARRAGIHAPARDRMTSDCSRALARVREFWQDEVHRTPTGNPIVVAQGDLFFATLPEFPQLVARGGVTVRVTPVSARAHEAAIREPRASFRIDPTRAELAMEIATRDVLLEITILESGAPRELLLALQQSYAPLLADLGSTKRGGK